MDKYDVVEWVCGVVLAVMLMLVYQGVI